MLGALTDGLAGIAHGPSKIPRRPAQPFIGARGHRRHEGRNQGQCKGDYGGGRLEHGWLDTKPILHATPPRSKTGKTGKTGSSR
jgi:hypothetical protein